ncbi:MAG: hypothetical protein AAB366_01810 [Patescibacteria group bacterium]
MTILIKNIQLLDGTGKPPIKADVLIKNEKISSIQQTINYKADEIIDGRGAYLAPGFININNHQYREIDILFNSGQKDFISKGITTVIGGQSGFSLAPLLYGSIESVKTNIDWHTLSEFFDAIKKRPLGVNFGTFIGHTTVRRDIVREPDFRNLTPNELKIFNLILKRSFNEGAFGVSIGLNDYFISQISYFEFKKIAETTARFKKIYSVNLNIKKENLIDSVKKIIFLAKETGVKIFISDFPPIKDSEEYHQDAIKLIEENAATSDIYFNEKTAIISEKIMPIENAVKKISFIPARTFGLNKRGEIKSGNFADLVIFKEDEIREVILNGKRALKDGVFQNISAGKILKSQNA